MVAAFLGDHPHHQASLELFASAEKSKTYCAAHSLAEVYAALTRLPLRPPVAPEQALLFLQDARRRLHAIALSEAEYFEVLEEAARQGVVGGRLYDALLLACAEKAKAELIYTWNLGHFRQLRPDLARRIRMP